MRKEIKLAFNQLEKELATLSTSEMKDLLGGNGSGYYWSSNGENFYTNEFGNVFISYSGSWMPYNSMSGVTTSNGPRLLSHSYGVGYNEYQVVMGNHDAYTMLDNYATTEARMLTIKGILDGLALGQITTVVQGGIFAAVQGAMSDYTSSEFGAILENLAFSGGGNIVLTVLSSQSASGNSFYASFETADGESLGSFSRYYSSGFNDY